MASSALHHDLEAHGARHDGALPGGHYATGEVWHDMQREGSLHAIKRTCPRDTHATQVFWDPAG